MSKKLPATGSPVKKRSAPLMPKAERREAALVIALQLAKKVGARRVSLAMVAAKQKVTAPLLFHIFESREGLTKAIVKAAKAQGVVLPEAVPTVREQRAANKPKLAKLKAPVKPAPKAPAKKLAKLKAPVKKLATPKAPVKVPAKKPKQVAALLKPARKELTPAQKTAKAAADKARRATTPAEKFKSLPKPFEAAIAQVAAAA